VGSEEDCCRLKRRPHSEGWGRDCDKEGTWRTKDRLYDDPTVRIDDIPDAVVYALTAISALAVLVVVVWYVFHL